MFIYWIMLQVRCDRSMFWDLVREKERKRVKEGSVIKMLHINKSPRIGTIFSSPCLVTTTSYPSSITVF